MTVSSVVLNVLVRSTSTTRTIPKTPNNSKGNTYVD